MSAGKIFFQNSPHIATGAHFVRGAHTGKLIRHDLKSRVGKFRLSDVYYLRKFNFQASTAFSCLTKTETWWACPDLNREPKHYECSALTIELQARR